jgi:hypothetical protein
MAGRRKPRKNPQVGVPIYFFWGAARLIAAVPSAR